jgi:hypothetical protein
LPPLLLLLLLLLLLPLLLLLQSQAITVYHVQQTVTQPEVPPAFAAQLFLNMDQA